MKNRILVVVCCVAWMVSANYLLAAIRPSFGVGYAWDASDIVVVTQKENSNGVVTVQETWHGQLAKGEQIHVARLPQTPITVSTRYDEWFGKEPSTKAKKVGGERIVLFLKPVEVKPDAEITPASGIKRFRGASFWERGNDSVFEFASAVWFEQGQSYAFEQIMNPGPSELHPCRVSEEDLKKSALAILADKDSLEKAKSLEKPTDRVAALLSLTKGTFRQARREALVALGQCGKPALPILKEMVGNNAYSQDCVIEAIAEASGTDAGQEITAILEKEFAFWKMKAPELEVGWWNGAGKPLNSEEWKRLDKLRDRYGILYYGLCILKKHPYPPLRELVTQIRDLWVSLPQLNHNKPERNQIIETCEEVLKVLDQQPRQ
jgi:hypothetical protein